jgi:tetratricopeptide (TPR) repeat protein
MELESLLKRDEEERKLAGRLEKIRLDKVISLQGNKTVYHLAAREYPKAFAVAKLSVLDEEVHEAAARIKSSPIKEQLVAALDDWACVAAARHETDKLDRLLQVAQLADPDPVWGDKVRQLKVWNDPSRLALAELVKKAPEAKNMSPPMLCLVGHLLGKFKREPWLSKAQAQYPHDFWLNFDLGNAHISTNPEKAEKFFQGALAVRPNTSTVYHQLGYAIFIKQKRNRLEEAVNAYLKAIEIEDKELEPNHETLAIIYSHLGMTRYVQNRLNEASTACNKAIELHPKAAGGAGAYIYLGMSCYYQKRLEEAVAALRKAIEHDPEFATSYIFLGRVLYHQNDIDGAIAQHSKATGMGQGPGYNAARKTLASLDKGAEPKEETTLRQQALAELLKELDTRAAMLQKKPMEAVPIHNDMQFWQDEVVANLRVSLNSVPIHNDMQHWQTDPALAKVRVASELNKLPKEERLAWQKLWKKVDALEKQARASSIEVKKIDGQLNAEERQKAHTVELKSGKTYVFDLASFQFDTYLRLEKDKDEALKQNDDIHGLFNLNSRIVFTPKASGSYRLLVSEHQQRDTGMYTLHIRELIAGD